MKFGRTAQFEDVDLDLVQGGTDEFAAPSAGHFGGIGTSHFSFNGLGSSSLGSGGHIAGTFGGQHFGGEIGGISGGLGGGHLDGSHFGNGTITGGLTSGAGNLPHGLFGDHLPNSANQPTPFGGGLLGHFGNNIVPGGNLINGANGMPIFPPGNGGHDPVVGGTVQIPTNHDPVVGGTVQIPPNNGEHNVLTGGTVTPTGPNGAINGNVDPTLGGTVGPNGAINGNVDPTLAGTVGPNGAINGNVDPNINGHVDPNINGHVDPNINGHVDPNINGTVTPPPPVANIYQPPTGTTTTSFDIQSFGDPHVQAQINGVVHEQIDYMQNIDNFATFANTVGGATTISTHTSGTTGITVNTDVTLTGHGATPGTDWSVHVDAAGQVVMTSAQGSTTINTHDAGQTLQVGGATVTTSADHVVVHEQLADGGHVDTEIAVHGSNVDVESHGQGNAGLSGFVVDDHHGDANATYGAATYGADFVPDLTVPPAPVAAPAAPVPPAPPADPVAPPVDPAAAAGGA